MEEDDYEVLLFSSIFYEVRFLLGHSCSRRKAILDRLQLDRVSRESETGHD